MINPGSNPNSDSSIALSDNRPISTLVDKGKSLPVLDSLANDWEGTYSPGKGPKSLITESGNTTPTQSTSRLFEQEIVVRTVEPVPSISSVIEKDQSASIAGRGLRKALSTTSNITTGVEETDILTSWKFSNSDLARSYKGPLFTARVAAYLSLPNNEEFHKVLCKIEYPSPPPPPPTPHPPPP